MLTEVDKILPMFLIKLTLIECTTDTHPPSKHHKIMILLYFYKVCKAWWHIP